MSRLRPTWCPFLDADAEITCVESCTCMGRSRQVKGSSAFCMGKTQKVNFDVEGHNHANDYIFCTNAPFATPDHDFRIFALVVNKQDMENLHKLLHAATNGFMTNKEETC